MTARGYIAIAIFVVALIVVLFMGAITTDDPIVGPLMSLALTAVASIAPFLFPGFKQRFEEFSRSNFSAKTTDLPTLNYLDFEGNYRILLYGLPGSGKTTLIKSFLTVSASQAEMSTDEYDVYQNEVTVRLKPLIKQPVAIADYKGDKPSQIKVNPPEEFFGPKGDRKINALYFIVDMFPRFTDSQSNPLSPDRTKEHVQKEYEANTTRKIRSRVKETGVYISKWAIEEVFDVAFSSENLKSVRLVINKADLLRSVIEAGHISNVSPATLDKYAQKLYSEIEGNLKKACEINTISDFSTCIISAATGENVDSILGLILNDGR